MTHSCVSSKLTFPEHSKNSFLFTNAQRSARTSSTKPVHCQISAGSSSQRSRQLQQKADSPCSWRRHSHSCMASSSVLSPCTLARHSTLLNSVVPSNPQITHSCSWQPRTLPAMAALQWQPSAEIFFLLLPAPQIPTTREAEGTAWGPEHILRSSRKTGKLRAF